MTRIILILLFVFSSQTFANDLKVIDGDTIVLNGEKIRFAGIDAPEYKQDCINGDLIIYCGMFSKVLLTKKIGDEIPKCISEGKDVYGRTLAECFVKGESLSAFLVRSGYAFAYRKYSKKFIKDEEFANNLVTWADVIRKTFYEGGVDEIISTRRLVHIIEAFAIFKDKMKAIELCTNRFDTDTKTSFADLYTKIDGGEDVTSWGQASFDPEDSDDSEEVDPINQ